MSEKLQTSPCTRWHHGFRTESYWEHVPDPVMRIRLIQIRSGHTEKQILDLSAKEAMAAGDLLRLAATNAINKMDNATEEYRP